MQRFKTLNYNENVLVWDGPIQGLVFSIPYIWQSDCFIDLRNMWLIFCYPLYKCSWEFVLSFRSRGLCESDIVRGQEGKKDLHWKHVPLNRQTHSEMLFDEQVCYVPHLQVTELLINMNKLLIFITVIHFLFNISTVFTLSVLTQWTSHRK
jgi:hypothetical protein